MIPILARQNLAFCENYQSFVSVIAFQLAVRRMLSLTDRRLRSNRCRPTVVILADAR